MHAGLNFVTSTAIPLTGTVEEACQAPFDAFSNGQPNKLEYGTAIAARYANVTGLGMAVDALRFKIELNGDWVLTMGNRPLMRGATPGLQTVINSSGGAYTASDVSAALRLLLRGRRRAETSSSRTSGVSREAGTPDLRAQVNARLHMGADGGPDPCQPHHHALPAANRAAAGMDGPVPAPGPLWSERVHWLIPVLPLERRLRRLSALSEQEADYLGSVGTFDTGYASERAAMETGWRQRLYAGVAGAAALPGCASR